MSTKLRGAHYHVNKAQGRPPTFNSVSPTHPAVVWIGYILIVWCAWYVYGVEDFTMSGDVTLPCRVQPWRFRRSYRNGNANGMLSSKSFVVLYSLQSYSTVRCTTMHTQRGLHHPRRLVSRNVSSTQGSTGAKTLSAAPSVQRRWRVQLTSPRPHRTLRTQSAVLVHGDRVALSRPCPLLHRTTASVRGDCATPFLVPLHVPTLSIELWELHHANQYNSCTASSSSIHHQSPTQSANHPH